MNRIRRGVAVLALVAGAALSAPGQEAAPGTVEIKVTAKKYEFDPGQIRVKKGDHVKLILTAVDHDHGFKLDAFQIDQKVKKGQTAAVEFTADKTGTFPFACSKFCGMGHKGMKGEVVVE
jgi:cytochrome c oxidase subunit 2